MFNEYSIDLIAVDNKGYLEGEYPLCKICSGIDEYDALTSFIRKYAIKLDEENLKLNIHLSRVKPIENKCNGVSNREIYKDYTYEEQLINQIAYTLKTFGFRIIKKDNYYLVRIPSFYITDSIIEFFDDRQVYKMNSLDLILLWNNNINEWTSKEDREFFKLNSGDLLVFLGETNDEEKNLKVCSALKENGITHYSFDAYEGCKVIAVLTEQINMVQPLISLICENISVNDKNLNKYFNITA